MLQRFIPRMRVDSIYEIDLVALKAEGIRGIMSDLDNTLVGPRHPHATEELAVWFKKVQEEYGLKVVLLSNNNESRVRAFAKPLGIPYVFKARKPRLTAFTRGIEQLGLHPGEVAMIGDQLMTDVLGGSRAGVFTILVKPLILADEEIPTRINRVLEKIARVVLRVTGHWKDGGT